MRFSQKVAKFPEQKSEQWLKQAYKFLVHVVDILKSKIFARDLFYCSINQNNFAQNIEKFST